MNTRELWGQGLTTVGAIAMLVGAVDPMEGSIVIFAGSAFMAIGAYLNPMTPRAAAYRAAVFVLILIGVGALWGLSTVGGVGGESGHSFWWAVLILPYLVGWVMGILGRDSPRWVLWAGGVVGLWYLIIPVLMLRRAAHQSAVMLTPSFIMGGVGLVTLIGCYLRLRQPPQTPTARPPLSQPVSPNR